jgi:hypothetical protein
VTLRKLAALPGRAVRPFLLVEVSLKRQNFLFVNLAEQASGAKPFDGMAAGEFTDMYGRKARFKKEDLPAYVQNTKAVLASTADSEGNVVGLPIDGMNHDHQEAAGWVVDVNLGEGGEVIQFTPRWNDWGMALISKDVMRFFSPTVDLSNKSIMGGSLTNWPATRDEQSGKILLKPIELSAQIYEMTDESLLERANNIARAFRSAFRDQFDTEYAWPVDVFDGYVICELNDKLYKVTFSEGEDGFVFAEFDQWIEVKRSYVEAALREVKKLLSGLFGKAGENVNNGGEHPADNQPETGVIEMEMTEQQLAELINKSVAAALANKTPAPDLKAADLSALLDLEGLSDDARKQRKAELAAYIASERTRAENEWRAEMARFAHESNMAQLSSRLVSGTDECPRGLRASAEELKAHLMKLDPDEAKFWGDLMTAALEKGFVEFSERGHGRQMQGTQVLPAGIAASLKAWTESGQTVEEFFRVNAVELGNMADYNLADFQPKEK